MIRLQGIRLPLEYDDGTVRKITAKTLRIPEDEIKSVSLYKRSVDAREKDAIFFVCTVDAELRCGEQAVLSKNKRLNATIETPYRYEFSSDKKLDLRPLVVGAGPAGLFAALILAENGAKPLIIERGGDVTTRQRDVERFWETSVLNENSNVQFGEGGAGTFSDGKLNTGIKDGRIRKVLNEFALCGAPDEILYNAKPHIGTDRLIDVVKNLRHKITALGGEFKFNTTLTGITFKNGRVHCARYTGGESCGEVFTDSIILAIGHSARDTFEMLYESGVEIEQKSFSAGVRIEHLRTDIDKAQYGRFAGNKTLGPADYKLSASSRDGRGAYTFCMCPGGRVVGASSEKNCLVTNGMSFFSRDGINSNSALLVSVTQKDFESVHPLAGVAFQRKLEAAAFSLGGGGYKAPVQRVGDFLNSAKSVSLGSVIPSYLPGYTLTDLHKCLPDYISHSLKSGIRLFESRIKGFSGFDAVLTGVETRSSSPVRILRDARFEAVKQKGLYPCGEGAGYAGGIISAAVDGIKCAEALLI